MFKKLFFYFFIFETIEVGWPSRAAVALWSFVEIRGSTTAEYRLILKKVIFLWITIWRWLLQVRFVMILKTAILVFKILLYYLEYILNKIQNSKTLKKLLSIYTQLFFLITLISTYEKLHIKFLSFLTK